MKSRTQVLFTEDFSALPIGVVAGDYSPAGEYHVIPKLSESGRWRETVIHYSYGDRGNWQVVLEPNGIRALEQTIIAPRWEPMMAAGEPFWLDTTVELSLRPLTKDGWRAVIFRYRHARRFYAVTFVDDRLQVIRRDNDIDTVLGDTTYALDPSRYTRVRVTCHGERMWVSLDGTEVLTCTDSSTDAFLEGCIAVAATYPTRFCNVQVTAAPERTKVLVNQRRATAKLRERHPRPVLWKKIPTPKWGADRNLRIGDINGDGKPELVLAQQTDRLGAGNFSSITSLAAYDLNGICLWTLGEPNPKRWHATFDLPFQLHDIDGDGRAEIIFCQDFELFIADGTTGHIRHSMPLPYPLEQDRHQLYRILGDAIFFCDLTGSGRPDAMVLKDRYRNAWAYDKNLKPLWSFSGKLGHYPFARDIDSDGKDELIIGYHFLDHDGTVKWTANYTDHADNVTIVDFSKRSGTISQSQNSFKVLIAGSDAGFYILDLAGREQTHYPIGHAQSMCVANILPERDGLEIAVNTFWGPCGIVAVFDEEGRLLHDFEPMPYACLLQPVNWVPLGIGALPADLLLLSTHIVQGGLIDGYGRRAVMFPDDGHPTLCSDARDLDGDGIDEVLTWNEEEIWIYKANVDGRNPSNYPRRNPWYNDSNYRAQLSLPR